MLHYTLNNGHIRVCPPEEVATNVLESLRPMCQAGCHFLPFRGYRVYTSPRDNGGLSFTVFDHSVPVVTCDFAPDDESAAEVWQGMERFYLRISDMPTFRGLDWASPRQPHDTPWLATVNLVASPVCNREKWLPDFERCLARTWLLGAQAS